MSVKRIIAIGCIYAIAMGGWWILGITTSLRSEDRKGKLAEDVETLWGTALVQEAPSLYGEDPLEEGRQRLLPAKNDIVVTLETDYRKKGLVWYPTYVCCRSISI